MMLSVHPSTAYASCHNYYCVRYKRLFGYVRFKNLFDIVKFHTRMFFIICSVSWLSSFIEMLQIELKISHSTTTIVTDITARTFLYTIITEHSLGWIGAFHYKNKQAASKYTCFRNNLISWCNHYDTIAFWVIVCLFVPSWPERAFLNMTLQSSS